MCINNNSTMFNHDMDIINMLNKDKVYLHSKNIGCYTATLTTAPLTLSTLLEPSYKVA